MLFWVLVYGFLVAVTQQTASNCLEMYGLSAQYTLRGYLSFEQFLFSGTHLLSNLCNIWLKLVAVYIDTCTSELPKI